MTEEKPESKRQRNFQLTRDTALKQLKEAGLSDLEELAGVKVFKDDAGRDSIKVDYLGKPVSIIVPEMTITCRPEDWTDLGGDVKLQEEIFILHYLLDASGKLPSGKVIPFRSMDGGMAYDSVFQGRTVNRLKGAFGGCEDLLIEIGALFGGEPSDMGNVSIKLRVLPHVEIAIILWKGDDEIPSSGNILFDDSILAYLPSEDSVVMAEAVVSRIVHILKNRK